MGVRKPISVDAEAKFGERLTRQIGRVYLLWLAGILVGVVKIRPEQFDFGGIKYTIANPEILQGVVFFACILYYVALFASFFGFYIEYVSSNRRILRRMIVAVLGKRSTFGGRTATEIRALKSLARFGMKLVGLFAAICLLLPLGHIVFFQQTALFNGVDAIFGTASVKDGKVVLNSAPAFVISLIVLTIFTGTFNNWMKKLSGASVGNLLWASCAATLVYAFLDSSIRGGPWTDAWGRTLLPELAILSLVAVVLGPLKVMLWQQRVRIWWLRWRAARLRE